MNNQTLEATLVPLERALGAMRILTADDDFDYRIELSPYDGLCYIVAYDKMGKRLGRV